MTGIVPVVIAAPAPSIIINRMSKVKNGTHPAGEDDRASQRPVGPLRKIRGQHDLLHGVPPVIWFVFITTRWIAILVNSDQSKLPILRYN